MIRPFDKTQLVIGAFNYTRAIAIQGFLSAIHFLHYQTSGYEDLGSFSKHQPQSMEPCLLGH